MKTSSSLPATRVVPQGDAGALIVRLLQFIGERRLEPGERLPAERLLAERFGVTRTIVREALTVLDAMRIVECRARSGVYLRAEAHVGSLDAVVMKADLGLPFGPSEAEELNEFRSILESQAIPLACARRTPQDIARLDACMDLCRERLQRGESIAQPSADFHLALVAATHNQFLLRAANSCYLATREPREALFADPEIGLRSIRDHQEIRDAIAAGSITRARKALKAHLDVAGHYWRAHIEPAPVIASKPTPAKHRRHRGSMTG